MSIPPGQSSGVGDAALEKLLTPVDVAALLGVPVSTLAVWRHRGYGPTFLKIGCLVRYQPAAVMQWFSPLAAW